MGKVTSLIVVSLNTEGNMSRIGYESYLCCTNSLQLDVWNTCQRHNTRNNVRSAAIILDNPTCLNFMIWCYHVSHRWYFVMHLFFFTMILTPNGLTEKFNDFCVILQLYRGAVDVNIPIIEHTWQFA